MTGSGNISYFHFREISSTNDYAKELLGSHAEVVVTADYQTKGRGRSNRQWEGSYGENLYFSYGINHAGKPAFGNIALYQAVGCLAAKKTLTGISGADLFHLKYPNDLLVRDVAGTQRKISGILTEHSFVNNNCVSTVMGIGINLNQKSFSPEIRDISVSLIHLGIETEPAVLTEKLAETINYFLGLSEPTLHHLWRNELGLEGRLISLSSAAGIWRVAEFMPDARLKVENIETGEIKLIDNGDSIRYAV